MFFSSIRNSLSRAFTPQPDSNPFGGSGSTITSEARTTIINQMPLHPSTLQENEDDYIDLDTLFK